MQISKGLTCYVRSSLTWKLCKGRLHEPLSETSWRNFPQWTQRWGGGRGSLGRTLDDLSCNSPSNFICWKFSLLLVFVFSYNLEVQWSNVYKRLGWWLLYGLAVSWLFNNVCLKKNLNLWLCTLWNICDMWLNVVWNQCHYQAKLFFSIENLIIIVTGLKYEDGALG